MDLYDLLEELLEDGMTMIWLYPTKDSSGSELFQLLDEFGGELAWRWGSDGHLRWRIQMSSLPAYKVRPANADAFDLKEGIFQLGMIDAANGAEAATRPDWCC